MGPVTTTQVSVPDEHVGRLIGRGGETINRIRQQSGCRIDIAKSDSSNTTGLRIVTLSGDQSAIMRAQDMLRQKLAEAQQMASGGGYGSGGGAGQQQQQQQQQQATGNPPPPPTQQLAITNGPAVAAGAVVLAPAEQKMLAIR